jgi:hypothetical protein
MVRLLFAMWSPQRAGSWHQLRTKEKARPFATGLPPLVRRSRLVPQEPNRTVRVPRSADDSAARSETAWLLPFQNEDFSVRGVASESSRRAGNCDPYGGAYGTIRPSSLYQVVPSNRMLSSGTRVQTNAAPPRIRSLHLCDVDCVRPCEMTERKVEETPTRPMPFVRTQSKKVRRCKCLKRWWLAALDDFRNWLIREAA